MTTPNRNRSLDIFRELFAEYMPKDDCISFYSNRKKDGTETFLRSDIYSGEKLSTIILEEYAIKSKMSGNVIVVLPDPQFDVPVFTFQLGGTDSQSIALLDISPTLPGIDYTPLISTYERYRDLLGVEEPKVEWVKSICSPYLLHCQYSELDEKLFMEALREYLDIWIEHYYLPGKALKDSPSVEIATNAVYKYKHVLHDNDPAYGIFAKAWGKPVADAFFYLETHQHPALPVPDEQSKKIKPWKNTDLNVIWTPEAQKMVLEAPESVQSLIRDAIENKVAAADIGIVTADVLNHYAGTTAEKPSPR